MQVVKKILEYNLKEYKKYIATEKIETLHSLKLYLDDLYYNTDQPGTLDSFYDILKDELMLRDSSYVPPIGAKIRVSENRVRIPFYMGSVNKITPFQQKELDKWVVENPCRTLLLSEKLDGVSGTFTCNDGKMKLYTRGDGEIGANISYLIQYITTIPKICEDISIRGELIIKKKVFEKKYYCKNSQNKITGENRLYKNARNMVSGIVGAKTIRDGIYDIEFLAYEQISNSIMPAPYLQMKRLQALGFKTALYKKSKIPSTMQEWIDLHAKFKQKSKYEIDGMVVQSNVTYDRNTTGNPSYMFAFKVCSEDSIYETTVLDIEWSVSSWGQIIPVAIITPIELPSNTIKRVTVSNAGLMQSKHIGPGAIIRVTRSNDVIPFIVSVSKQCDTLKWPSLEYTWDANNVHLKVVNANDDITKQMKVKLFTRFFTKMGIKFVSNATITKMYEHGFDTLLKIIAITEIDLLKIDGIQEKSSSRIVKNIKNGLQQIKASELMGACGIFGFGIGRKRVITLMTDIPDLLERDKTGLKERILKVEGFSEIMAEKVINNIEYAITFMREISTHVSFAVDTRKSNSLVGLKYAFSGFRSLELEKDIQDRGGIIVTSISKKTTAIIVQTRDTTLTGKVSKAMSLGVVLYTKDEFIKLLVNQHT